MALIALHNSSLLFGSSIHQAINGFISAFNVCQGFNIFLKLLKSATAECTAW